MRRKWWMVVLAGWWVWGVAAAVADDYRLEAVDGGWRLGRSGGGEVFTYVTERPEGTPYTAASACFVYPLRTPAGHGVVELAPDDHPHHRGVFLAWHSVLGERCRADFWGWGEFAPTAGRVIENVGVTPAGDGVIEVRNRWVAGGGGDVFFDERTVIAVSRSGRANVVDFDFRLEAKQRVVIEASAFGGFNVKCRRDGEVTLRDEDGVVDGRPGPHYLDRSRNWRGGWYDYELATAGGEVVGVTVVDHPDNPPCAWHVVREIGMLNPNIVSPGAVEMAAGEVLRLRYRVVVRDGVFDGAGVERLAAAFRGRDG